MSKTNRQDKRNSPAGGAWVSTPPTNQTTATKQANAKQTNATNIVRSKEERLSDAFSPEKLAAIRIERNGKPFKLTRKLAILRNAQNLTFTCPLTGIVGQLVLPAIPGFTLINRHPLSQLENARELAQRGRNYLKQLDSNVLAGLFICLASDYELLSTGAKWHAVQANNILKTVGPEALIEAILLIEQWVHSNNAIYLPRLSLEPSFEETVSTMQGRIINWFRLLHDAIVKPDTSIYDANKKPTKTTFASVEKISVKNRAITKQITIERKMFSSVKKIIKEEAPKLKSASSKLRNYLLTLSTGNLLLTADPGMLILLTEKLKDCTETVSAAAIIEALEHDFQMLKEEQGLSDPFAEDDESEDSAEGTATSIHSSINSNPNSINNSNSNSINSNNNSNNNSVLTSMLDKPIQAAVLINGPTQTSDGNIDSDAGNDESEPNYAGLTPIQAIIAKKAWQRRTGRSQALPFKTNEEEQEKYSIPAGTIIGQAPVYVPSAEKDKLAGYTALDGILTFKETSDDDSESETDDDSVADDDGEF